MRERNLWWYANKWSHPQQPGAEIQRLPGGTGFAVFSVPIAESVLCQSNRHLYEDQSGFLRTSSHTPLPLPVRHMAILAMQQQLKVHQAPSSSDIRDFLVELSPTHTQRWGVLAARFYFDSFLARDRSFALQGIVDEYINEVVVRDSIRGLGPRRRTERVFVSLCQRASRAIADEPLDAASRDLVDIVKVVGDAIGHDGVGELYLRLVLSTVGFTGVATEWLCTPRLEPARGGDVEDRGSAMARLLYLQTILPTAWRLVRTVAQPHELGGQLVAAGDDIIIATGAVNRDGGECATYSFGSGPGKCPARGPALRAICDIEMAIRGGLTVDTPLLQRRRPYTLTLLSPPRVPVKFARARMDETCS